MNYVTTLAGQPLLLILLISACSAFAVADTSVKSQIESRSSEVRVQLDEKTPFFSLSSKLNVGNKGEELIDVSQQATCGQAAWVYDHAELVIDRKRFGNAQFVALPQTGCLVCEPIKVRWYHEPTGYLTFSVNIFRRQVTRQCSGDTPNNSIKQGE